MKRKGETDEGPPEKKRKEEEEDEDEDMLLKVNDWNII